MKQKFIYQILVVLIVLVACTDSKTDSELEPDDELKVFYQEINEVLADSGTYYLDFDGDLVNDFYLKLYHSSGYDPFNPMDTFYIAFASLSNNYFFMNRSEDCVPCYEYNMPIELMTGSGYSDISRVISSHYIETGIEGKKDSYLWLEKHEKSGINDYYFEGWLRIEVSENRDVVTIKDCALRLDRNMPLPIGIK